MNVEISGESSLLERPLTGLVGSVEVPPDLILPTLELVLVLRAAGVAVIGGFQTRLEAKCLALLLRGPGPVLVIPARSLAELRIPADWGEPLRSGRMALISGCPANLRRVSVAGAARRNQLLGGLVAQLVVIHARPGSRTLALAAEVLERRKPVLCFDHPANRDLLLRGAKPLTREAVADLSFSSPASRSR